MNGYVIADFKDVKLSTSEPKTIKGISKSFKSAYELKKPLLCSNINISEQDNNSVLSCFGNVIVADNTYSIYIATYDKSGIFINVDDNDVVTFSVVQGE